MSYVRISYKEILTMTHIESITIIMTQEWKTVILGDVMRILLYKAY
jgi:hypothetical protein